MSRTIVWFRNDLRTVDNAALLAACADHDEVLPLYVLDPRQHGPSPLGIPRSGVRRRAFLRRSLLDLESDLRKLGSALRVVWGEPGEVIGDLVRTWHVDRVHVQRGLAWEEHLQQEAVARCTPTVLHPPPTLLDPADLPFSLAELPHMFTRFRQRVEHKVPVRAPLPGPATMRTPADWGAWEVPQDVLPVEAPPEDPRAVMSFPPGRGGARARLTHYFSGNAPAHYKATRNAMLGADTSSKFSPWLASGALSVHELHAAVLDHERRNGVSEGTRWLVFELLWRDFFHFTAAKHGRHLFTAGGIQRSAMRGSRDGELFRRWCEGRTGQPFIDATMRELAATGWMSNRGRQNAASFLVHDLGLDWRMGAWWFEHHLLDHDPCSNWGNWQYVAGVGNDPRPDRRFDPVRQAAMYDPDGTYRATWAY